MSCADLGNLICTKQQYQAPEHITHSGGSQHTDSVGESSPINLVHHSRSGSTRPRLHWFIDVFGEAYAAELAHFVKRVRIQARADAGDHVGPEANGEDGRAALVLALAAIRSVETGQAVRIAEIKP